MNELSPPDQRPNIESVLDSLGVTYVRYDHAPVFTCDEALAAVPDRDSVQTKNLFLRDKTGRRHILLITTCEKPVDIRRFGEETGLGRLSFGSAERMQARLGVTPGSVTILALVNDSQHTVELYVDADLWRAAKWNCHPLVNSATLVIDRAGIQTFLAHTGHVPRVVNLAERPE